MDLDLLLLIFQSMTTQATASKPLCSADADRMFVSIGGVNVQIPLIWIPVL